MSGSDKTLTAPTPRRRRRLLSQGESVVATAGLVFAMILFCVVGLTAWRTAGGSEAADSGTGGLWSLYTALGITGVLVTLALLVVYRRMRVRTRGLSVIRDALVALERESATLEALAVAETLGPEARAWNELLNRVQELERERLNRRAGLLLASVHERRGDLDRARDLMPQGLILLDREGTIAYLNGSAAEYIGSSRKSLLDQPASAVLTDESIREAMRSTLHEQRRSWTAVELTQSEGGRGAVLRYAVRGLGGEGGALIVVDDITQQRVAESSRNSFVAQVTHELRMPLTNIRLYVENAIEDGENHEPRIREALNVINQEAKRLERIVGDMLSVAEIEAGKYEVRRDDVRLQELLDILSLDYATAAQEKSIDLGFKMPPKLPIIQADRDKISMALHNLIGNAIKYTPENGHVEVRVDTDDDGITVEVSDSGIGINRDEQERVFEKFYRARDKRIATVTGSGLGLALAREVIRMHGGDITVESELDKGSTFTLTVPQYRNAA